MQAVHQTTGESQISDSDDVVRPQAKGDFDLRMNYALNFGILILPPGYSSTKQKVRQNYSLIVHGKLIPRIGEVSSISC